MKIALVTDKFIVGGGLEHIYQIAKKLPSIHFGIFANGGDVGKASLLPNVEIFCDGNRPGQILKFKPSLIHIHHLKPLLNFYWHPFKKYRIPVLFTVHGLHVHKYEFKKGLSNRLQFHLRSGLERYLFRKVTKLITVSFEDAQFIDTRYRLRSICIPNGLDLSKIDSPESAKSIRNELNLPANHQLFLTVARFDFQKGYDILLRAISEIKDQIAERKIKFIFVGQGDLFDEMKQMATRLAISDLITFMGPRNDVYRIMRACDLFILPSRWEGLPIVLIEAGLCKLPILASDTYGNREVVRNGIEGLLFKNEDSQELACKIMHVVKNKKDIAPMGHIAYDAFRKKYDARIMVRQLQDIYTSAANFAGTIGTE
jgi:glycosyltransferase involved in cell wall biosynthesis